MDLIAKKPMTYATRRLKAGDTFPVAHRSHARALIALGKASAADEATNATTPPKQPAPQTPPPPPPPPAGSEGTPPDVAALRASYEKLFGKKPFNGWTADVLAAKISEKTASS